MEDFNMEDLTERDLIFFKAGVEKAKEEFTKDAIDHYCGFNMYCEKPIRDKLLMIRESLHNKGLIFKFDGEKYAIFSSDMFDRTQVIDYKLTLKELEEFAERA